MAESRAELSQAASALQAQMLGTTLGDKSLDTCYLIIQDDVTPPPMDDGSAPSDRPRIILDVLCPSRGLLGTKAARMVRATDRINNLNPRFTLVSNDPEIRK